MCAPVSGGGGSSNNKESNREQSVEKENMQFKYKVEKEGNLKVFDNAKEISKNNDNTTSTFAVSRSTYEETEEPPVDVDVSGSGEDENSFGDDSGSDTDGTNEDELSEEIDEAILGEDEEGPLNDEDNDDENLDEIDVSDGEANVKETEGKDSADGDEGKADGKITADDKDVKMNNLEVKTSTRLSIKNIPKNFIELHKTRLQQQKDEVAKTKAEAKENERTYFGQLNHNRWEQQRESVAKTKEQVKEPEGKKTYFGQLNHNRWENQKLAFKIERMPGLSVGKVESEFQVSKQASEKIGSLIGTAGDALEKATKQSKDDGDDAEQKKSVTELREDRDQVNKKIDEQKTKITELSELKEKIYSANPEYHAIIQKQDSLAEEFKQNIGNDEEIERIKGEQATVKQERADWEKAHPDVKPINQINTKINALNKSIGQDIKTAKDLSAEIKDANNEAKRQDTIEHLKDSINTMQEIKDKLDSGGQLTIQDVNTMTQIMHDLKCIPTEKGEKFLHGIDGGGDFVAASFQEAIKDRDYEKSSWRESIEKINEEHGTNIKTDHIDLLKVMADHTKAGVDGSDLITSFSTQYEARLAGEGFHELKDFADSIKDLSGFAEAIKEFNEIFKEVKMDYHCSKPGSDSNSDSQNTDTTTRDAGVSTLQDIQLQTANNFGLF